MRRKKDSSKAQIQSLELQPAELEKKKNDEGIQNEKTHSSVSSATDSKEKIEEAKGQQQSPDPVLRESDLEDERIRAVSDLNDSFLRAIRPCVRFVEQHLEHAASQTVPALFQGIVSRMTERSEIGVKEVPDLNVLGELNYDLQRDLDRHSREMSRCPPTTTRKEPTSSVTF